MENKELAKLVVGVACKLWDPSEEELGGLIEPDDMGQLDTSAAAENPSAAVNPSAAEVAKPDSIVPRLSLNLKQLIRSYPGVAHAATSGEEQEIPDLNTPANKRRLALTDELGEPLGSPQYLIGYNFHMLRSIGIECIVSNFDHHIKGLAVVRACTPMLSTFWDKWTVSQGYAAGSGVILGIPTLSQLDQIIISFEGAQLPGLTVLTQVSIAVHTIRSCGACQIYVGHYAEYLRSICLLRDFEESEDKFVNCADLDGLVKAIRPFMRPERGDNVTLGFLLSTFQQSKIVCQLLNGEVPIYNEGYEDPLYSVPTLTFMSLLHGCGPAIVL